MSSLNFSRNWTRKFSSNLAKVFFSYRAQQLLQIGNNIKIYYSERRLTRPPPRSRTLTSYVISAWNKRTKWKKEHKKRNKLRTSFIPRNNQFSSNKIKFEMLLLILLLIEQRKHICGYFFTKNDISDVCRVINFTRNIIILRCFISLPSRLITQTLQTITTEKYSSQNRRELHSLCHFSLVITSFSALIQRQWSISFDILT